MANRVVFVVDKSSSMGGLRSKVVEVLNQTIETLPAGSEVSLLFFSDKNQEQVVRTNVKLKEFKPLEISEYLPSGMTALHDGILKGAELINKPRSRTLSYLVIAITDGGENDSAVRVEEFVKNIQTLQATDRWTFTALVPPGKKELMIQRGYHEGNVEEWTNMQKVAQSLNAGVTNYTRARAAGQRSTKNFFTTDLTKVDLDKLPPVRGVKHLTVDKETEIKPFIESQGLTFETGRAFYQLTKPETVQPEKEMLLIEKGKRTVYGQARDHLGY
jgi:hypothetical protein